MRRDARTAITSRNYESMGVKLFGARMDVRVLEILLRSRKYILRADDVRPSVRRRHSVSH